ncbi:MAG: hypothetical protein Q9222_001624 [Ikaeria aurantiellina]
MRELYYNEDTGTWELTSWKTLQSRFPEILNSEAVSSRPIYSPTGTLLLPPDPPPRRPIPPPFAAVKSSNLANSRFLSLPPEVRLNIYSFCLINYKPIVVWSARYEEYWGANPSRRLQWDREAMAASTRGLAVGLLRCSTSVAVESAPFFYENNTFVFRGDHQYSPVIAWLDKIGENREHLRSLELTIRRPRKAWQMTDGSRYREDFTSSKGLAFHHPHFARLEGLYEEGEVDIVDPAIETIISMLARSVHGQAITLSLDTGCNNIPGIELFVEEGTSLFTMDLPNLIEKWRTSYFSESSYASLDIIWKAAVGQYYSIENRRMIEALGWDICEEQEGMYTHEFQSRPGQKPREFPVTRIWMRRKPLTGQLIAAAPDPYSDWQGRPY